MKSCCPSCTCGQPPVSEPQPPVFQCTDGVVVFSDAAQAIADLPVRIENAFNTNDGPAPWTTVSAQFTGTQQAIYDLTETVCCRKTQSAFTVMPSVRVMYNDGTGTSRTKMISFPVKIEQCFETSCFAPAAKYYVELLPGAALANLAASGAAVSFTAGFTLRILAYSEKRRFSAAAVSSPEQACGGVSANFLRIKSACTVNSATNQNTGTIPFEPAGTAPYTVQSITPLDMTPSTLLATQSSGRASLFMAFPAQIVLSDSTGKASQQDVSVYAAFDLSSPCFSYTYGEPLAADLRVTYGSPYFANNILYIPIASLTGSLTAFESASGQALLDPCADCAPSENTCTCAVIQIIEPTTAP